MTEHPEINEQSIREALIKRATAYASANGTSFSAIGVAAVQDSKFLARVKNQETGFNIKTYQRVIDWLDAQEAAVTQAAE